MEEIRKMTDSIINSLIEHDVILTDHDIQLAWELVYNKLTAKDG